MHSESIGKIVNKLRKKADITKRALAFGICPEATISRLESGEQIPDVLTLEAIFSRLGKSVNKLEILFQNTDYADYCFYQNLEVELEQGNEAEVRAYIEILQRREKWKKPVYCQYLKKVEIILEENRISGETKKRMLEDAIRMTMPDFQIGKVQNYLFSEEEITLILMWLQVRGKLGDAGAYAECRSFLKGLEHGNYDEEMWVSVYPKIIWVLLELEQGKEKQQEEKSESRSVCRQKNDLELVQKVRSLLTDNGVLLYFTEFLELELQILKALEMSEAYEALKKQRDALKWVYDRYREEYHTGGIKIWKKYRQQNIYLLSETVKRERNYLQLTQEAAAELARLDQKTLSRIETGANHLKPGTFRKLQEALQLERDLCSTKIDVDDFELLELERDLTRELIKKNYMEAEDLFEELKGKLSLESKKNQQYVEFVSIEILFGEGKLEIEELLERTIQIFSVTREFKVENLENMVLSQLENRMLAMMAACYGTLGQREYAIRMLEGALSGYRKSEVDEINLYKELTVILGWLTDTYEENNQFEKAMEYSEKNIRLELKCKRSNLLARRVMENVYIDERRGEKPMICIPLYQKVYRLLLLLNPGEKVIDELKEHFFKSYGEELN